MRVVLEREAEVLELGHGGSREERADVRNIKELKKLTSI